MFSIVRTFRARTALVVSTTAVAVTTAIAAGPAGAAAPRTGHAHGPIRGIVPSRQSHNGRTGSSTSSNLIYHGGPVLDQGNTAYAIFWSPSNWSQPIPGSYQTLITRYLTDVAAATRTGTNTNTNVYDAATQYGPTTSGTTLTHAGTLSNLTTFGGAYPDTAPITNDCRDRATSVCVSDAQMVKQLTAFTQAQGLPQNGSAIYFVFTPKGVGSCYANNSCSFTQFCAYHSNSGGLLYANMPFADTVPAACDAGFHPNASIDPNADATINVLSHEHNETITDPLGSAWYNSSGYENGDLCAWNFGGISGSSAYNQTLNGDHYALQQEWSNAHNGGKGACVLQGL